MRVELCSAIPAVMYGLRHASELRLARLATLGWAVAALGKAWAFVAEQSPSSPLYVGMLPGPIDSLAQTGFWLGTVCWVSVWAVPRLFPDGSPRWWVPSMHVGVFTMLVAAGYAAARGVHGVQVFDPRVQAQVVVGMRLVGFVCVVACGVVAAGRLWWRER